MLVEQCKVSVVLALHDKSGPWPWPRGSCPWLHHCLLQSQMCRYWVLIATERTKLGSFCSLQSCCSWLGRGYPYPIPSLVCHSQRFNR